MNRRPTNVFLSILAGCFCGVVAGCGGDDLSAVNGTVTLDGKPLHNGVIRFMPSDGATASASGLIQQGSYKVDVPPGPKIVEITSQQVVRQEKAYEGDPNSPTIDVTKEIIPAKFNVKSELKYDVTSGENTKDFAVTSK